jgi:Centromere DNA-binding protein complex CBF3 subunit, domain 2/Transcriptional activator of glycolytic enzymes
MNCHPSPRVDNCRQYLKTLQRRDTERMKEQFADKGRDTLLDGYNREQFERVCESLWDHSDASPECHFRTLVDFLLSHYMLARGVDRRTAELSDLFTFEFPHEGPTRCMPLIFTTREGKTNKHGRLETTGALRHRNPLTCLLSALAFYLLYRWDLTDEPFPDFSRREAWYGTRVLASSAHGRSRGHGPEEQLAYSTQLDWINKALEYVGIASHKKTHIGRSSGAKLAELLGICLDEIRRQGHWNQEEMVGCYLNSLPREFMRVMAGHPRYMGCFEVPRASVAPPDELLSMIWPDLDDWKGRFGPQRDQVHDLAAMGVTDLLFYLREVILQDSVTLRKRFPRSPVWSHPVFQHPAYSEFAARMEAAVELVDDEERPTKLTLLAQAMPELAEGLHCLRGGLRELQSTVVGAVAEQMQAQSARWHAHTQQLLGSLMFRIDPSSYSCPPPSDGPVPVVVAAAAAASSSSGGSDTSTPPSLVPSLAPGPTASSPSSAGLSPAEPPRYTMCRSVKSVERLWQEWTVGLNGQPSVSALDSRWGSRWRSGRQRELQWYSLRLEVIREIRRRAKAQRSSEEQAMWSLHVQQQQMGCSLDRLCKQLRAGRS